MGSTYKSASITLVLDAGMRKCSIERPIEEIMLRILASTWMRRLWTLHEGALAGRLVFLLKDYFLDLNELLARIFEAGLSSPISVAVLSELSGFNRKLYAAKPAHINHVQRLIGYRTSSRLDDETLVLAPLFHIDVKRLTLHMGERRKMEFWNCLGTVPTEIIFSAAGRLTTRGYRWAPNMLMHGDANVFGPGQGRVTGEGLIGEFKLLELEKRLRLDVRKTYQLLDVVQRKAFRIFDRRDVGPEDQDQDHSLVCDAIAIRQQPTEELIPGAAVLLVRDVGLDEGEDEGGVGYEYGGKIVIVMDEFVELVFWEDLPSDAIVARSARRNIRIS
jgi:hypothetical protein